MNNPHNLKVGQVLLYANSGSPLREMPEFSKVSVMHVGPEWAELSGGLKPMYMPTLEIVHYGYVVGQCFLSKDHWRECAAVRQLWWDFCRRSQGTNPQPGVTSADIRAAAALLRVDLGEGETQP